MGERVLGRDVAVGRDAGAERLAQRDERGAAAARRELLRLRRAAGQQGDPAGAAHGEAADHERDALGDVGLQAVGGAERHRGGDVDEQPGRERALGHVVADVGDAGARAGGGIDRADVVAELVRPDLRELRAGAAARRPALARQHAGRAAGEHEVERLDERALHRARALAPGWVGELRAHAAIGWVGALAGRTPPTVSRMRASRSSACTPSPSAS